MFNNLLQSLFKSLILTLGIVMLGIFFMFLFLFRNLVVSLIGVVPNFLAAFFILGIIGLLDIPLDMMTITIAAITIGIAVDNSIHYIYRFKEEFKNIKSYAEDFRAVSRYCRSGYIQILHDYYCSLDFLSWFYLILFPTIYFGVFTANSDVAGYVISSDIVCQN